MFELTVIVEFEAAHRIVDYPGKCNRLHGHNWSVEVTLKGKKLNKLGMLMDFKEIKKIVNETIIDRLDHQYLNELTKFQEVNPTAEHIAEYIYNELEENADLAGNVAIAKVTVWESPKSAVTYYRDEE